MNHDDRRPIPPKGGKTERRKRPPTRQENHLKAARAEATAVRRERARKRLQTTRRHRLGVLKRRLRIEKRELRKRISGRPSRNATSISLPEIVLSGIGKVLKLALIIILVIGFATLGLGLGMLSAYIANATPLEVINIRYTNEPTEIVDRNGQQIAVLVGAQNIQREYIQISEVRSTYLEEAIKAIEDERFDTHIGIDPRRIGSAALSMLANGGTPTHGGSTITQQVVKMLSGQDEESAQRKIQEWYRAQELERRLSKDEIMELYINIIPMANNYVGVQAAAKAYFDKDASRLDLAECAFLAGIPNLPSIYNPLTEYGRRNALRRMRITLLKMRELGYVSEEEYQDALDRELVFRQVEPTIAVNQINSYFVDAAINAVIDDLMTKRGYSQQLALQAVYQQGLRIELTVDPDIQAAAEATFRKRELFATNEAALPDIPEPPQASITIISNEPATRGQVVGMVGGFGRKTGNFVLNRATQTFRQPGSAIKPLLVYAPAINSGAITAATIIPDRVRYLDAQNPTTPYPLNVTRTYEGNMTVRHALAYSVNTVAAEVYANILSPQIGLSYLRELGIDRMEETQVAASLGGFGYGMSTFEIAGAYTALANGGLYTKPYLYTRVIDMDGNVLLENKPAFRQVFSAETAFIVTDILRDASENVFWFVHSRLTDQMSAGKTGTTNDIIDSWYAGYTPFYTAAVWYGYDNRDGRRTEILEADRYNSQLIWKDAMEQIHADLPNRAFEKPETVVGAHVCSTTGNLAGPYCPSVLTEWFDTTKSNMPSVTCTYHRAPAPAPTRAPLPEVVPEPLPEPVVPDPAPGG
ncbi:MAG TPA: penicillin-binding protein [Clostridiaceae bacterium]|nr:penicillin-binding protein [Clostridiaceae bacterium]